MFEVYKLRGKIRSENLIQKEDTIVGPSSYRGKISFQEKTRKTSYIKGS